MKQLNNTKIEKKLEFLPLYNELGEYQKTVYDFIIKKEKAKKDGVFSTSAKNRKLSEKMDNLKKCYCMRFLFFSFFFVV